MTSLNFLQAIMKNVLQNSTDPRKQCSFLFMYNLAEPKWISIDCHEPLLSQVVCSKKQHTKATTAIHNDIRKKICSRGDIFIKDDCFSFYWFNSNLNKENFVFVCNKLNKKPLFASPMVTNHTLKNIFHAIGAVSVTFLLLNALPERVVSVSYKRYWTKTEIALSREKTKGHLTCISKACLKTPSYNIIFKCQTDHYISSAFVFDGENDCQSTGNDETTGHSVDKTSMCKPTFYKNVQGKCKSFALKHTRDKDKNKQLVTNPKNFTCSNGVVIDQDLVGDLVADCGETPDDEVEFVKLLAGKTFNQCKDPTQIPCFPGHSKCFDISDTCVYRLNRHGHLEPCRTGSHIQSCSKFECNSHFKCPEFYCIPWGYSCNGVWDCPDGTDETVYAKCYHRNCSGLFKCKNSKICLHLEDLCDGEC